MSPQPERSDAHGYAVCCVLVVVLWLLFVFGPQVAGASEARSGFAAHYRPGLMEQVARRRNLPDRGCLVASPYHGIGSRLEVASKRGRLRCLVADVPQPADRAAIVRRRIIVEFDFRSNARLCPARERPENCPVLVRTVP